MQTSDWYEKTQTYKVTGSRFSFLIFLCQTNILNYGSNKHMYFTSMSTEPHWYQLSSKRTTWICEVGELLLYVLRTWLHFVSIRKGWVTFNCSINVLHCFTFSKKIYYIFHDSFLFLVIVMFQRILRFALHKAYLCYAIVMVWCVLYNTWVSRFYFYNKERPNDNHSNDHHNSSDETDNCLTIIFSPNSTVT